MKINFAKSIEPLIKQSGNKAIEVGADMRYTLGDAKIGTDVYTRSCNSCTSVLLNSGDNNFLAHIDPKNFNLKTFTDTFKKTVTDFQKRFGEVKAVIFGGWENRREDAYCKTPSALVSSTIAAIIDDLPLVMICGKKQGVNTFDNIFVSKSNVTLSNQLFDKIKINSKMTSEELEEILGNYYEWVEIDKSML